MDGRDLREQMDSQAVADAFAKLVSGGKAGYKTVIEKDKKPKYCQECFHMLKEEDKFCANCGKKIEERK